MRTRLAPLLIAGNLLAKRDNTLSSSDRPALDSMLRSSDDSTGGRIAN